MSNMFERRIKMSLVDHSLLLDKLVAGSFELKSKNYAKKTIVEAGITEAQIYQMLHNWQKIWAVFYDPLRSHYTSQPRYKIIGQDPSGENLTGLAVVIGINFGHYLDHYHPEVVIEKSTLITAHTIPYWAFILLLQSQRRYKLLLRIPGEDYETP